MDSCYSVLGIMAGQDVSSQELFLLKSHVGKCGLRERFVRDCDALDSAFEGVYSAEAIRLVKNAGICSDAHLLRFRRLLGFVCDYFPARKREWYIVDDEFSAFEAEHKRDLGWEAVVWAVPPSSPAELLVGIGFGYCQSEDVVGYVRSVVPLVDGGIDILRRVCRSAQFEYADFLRKNFGEFFPNE